MPASPRRSSPRRASTPARCSTAASPPGSRAATSPGRVPPLRRLVKAPQGSSRRSPARPGSRARPASRELVAVGLVAHRERQLDLGLADRQLHPLAVMLDGDDVRALLGDELQELDELAGAVGEAACGRRGSGPPASARAASPGSGASGRCCRRRGSRTTSSSPGTLAGEQRGDRRGAGALDEQLRPLEQQHDRVADLLVGDGDDLVEQLARGSRRSACPAA